MQKQVNGETSSKRSRLWKLFWVSLKLGAFTFGGGYAMIPLMQKEYVDNNHWIEESDILDMFAIAQSVPGVIAINSSILIGYRVAGVAGALLAALGVTLPSLISIMLITLIYHAFIENPIVLAAMRGIRAGVVALIISAVVKLKKGGITDIWQWAMAIIAFLLVVFFAQIQVILLIVAGGVIGYLISLIRRRNQAKGGRA